MSSSVQYSAFTRLLTLNNRVHDLEELLYQMPVFLGEGAAEITPSVETSLSPLSEMQDEIDREVRASLVTCWLAMPEPLDD